MKKKQKQEFTWYSIWLALWSPRNELIFKNISPNFGKTSIWISNLYKDLTQSCKKNDNGTEVHQEYHSFIDQAHWMKSPKGYVTFNYDASFKVNKASLGLIARDHIRNVIGT